MGEFGVAGQWAGERKIWGPWESVETIDLVMTLNADSGSSYGRGGGFKRGYEDTSRGVDEAEIGSVEKRDRVRAAVSTEDTTTLSAMLIVNEN